MPATLTIGRRTVGPLHGTKMLSSIEDRKVRGGAEPNNWRQNSGRRELDYFIWFSTLNTKYKLFPGQKIFIGQQALLIASGHSLRHSLKKNTAIICVLCKALWWPPTYSKVVVIFLLKNKTASSCKLNTEMLLSGENTSKKLNQK